MRDTAGHLLPCSDSLQVCDALLCALELIEHVVECRRQLAKLIGSLRGRAHRQVAVRDRGHHPAQLGGLAGRRPGNTKPRHHRQQQHEATGDAEHALDRILDRDAGLLLDDQPALDLSEALVPLVDRWIDSKHRLELTRAAASVGFQRRGHIEPVEGGRGKLILSVTGDRAAAGKFYPELDQVIFGVEQPVQAMLRRAGLTRETGSHEGGPRLPSGDLALDQLMVKRLDLAGDGLCLSQRVPDPSIEVVDCEVDQVGGGSHAQGPQHRERGHDSNPQPSPPGHLVRSAFGPVHRSRHQVERVGPDVHDLLGACTFPGKGVDEA